MTVRLKVVYYLSENDLELCHCEFSFACWKKSSDTTGASPH